MSASTKIDVALLVDEDIPTCFKVLSESFGHNAPFVNIYFPNHDTLSGQVQGSSRLKAWKHNAPDSAFLKAVTTIEDNGIKKELIMGLAIWTHMKEIPPQKIEDAEDVEEVWPDLSDRKFMAGLWEDYVKPRTQAVKDSNGKGIYVLELLAVHPGFQRLGAGMALVTWGTRAADKLQVRAVVEGTPAGRRLYEKCGLHAEIEEMRFEPGEEFAERAKPKLVFMTREPVL
ncbi:hypothetical protein ONZ43_g1441 [Nemania bipapillata]|uniref:Uncharacterized protein n=1 Tax=Nemania bipapillata TaxID=110536 RepID=A0ACC2J4R4_9PEZI|nr:hypothetical protein ONZ43_g1441 [Nemania bipapillata]